MSDWLSHSQIVYIEPVLVLFVIGLAGEILQGAIYFCMLNGLTVVLQRNKNKSVDQALFRVPAVGKNYA